MNMCRMVDKRTCDLKTAGAEAGRMYAVMAVYAAPEPKDAHCHWIFEHFPSKVREHSVFTPHHDPT